MPLGRGFVVHRRVGHRETVKRAVVKLGAVGDTGLAERVREELLLLRRHRGVVVGVPDVHLRRDPVEAEVRAVGLVGDS